MAILNRHQRRKLGRTKEGREALKLGNERCEACGEVLNTHSREALEACIKVAKAQGA